MDQPARRTASIGQANGVQVVAVTDCCLGRCSSNVPVVTVIATINVPIRGFRSVCTKRQRFFGWIFYLATSAFVVLSPGILQVGGKGFALKAAEVIQAGEFVMEYVGEVIDDAQCEARLLDYKHSTGEKHIYLMELSCDVVIDASRKGNSSRFINHSCDPNCVTQKWYIVSYFGVFATLRLCYVHYRLVGSETCIGIFALKDIVRNAELTYDYKFKHFGEAMPCLCGAPQCSGIIGANLPPSARAQQLSYQHTLHSEAVSVCKERAYHAYRLDCG